MSRLSLPLAGRPPPIPSDHISFSSISTIAACPLRFFFKYVARLPEKTTNASLVVGSSFHAALEFYFQAMLSGEATPGLDNLLDVFWSAWNNEERAILFPKGEDVNSISRLAERLFKTFLAGPLARPEGTIIGVEEQLRGPLVPGVPDVLARIDLLVETNSCLIVTDFKTARSGWSDDHVRDAAGQLHLYHELTRPLADGKPIRLRFAVMTKGKFPDLSIHHVAPDSARLIRTKRIVERVWKAIIAENYYPNPSPMTCATCPYQAPCRSWTG